MNPMVISEIIPHARRVDSWSQTQRIKISKS